ncbi:hypothetical protein ABK040_014463 [Willaertia magna]
MENRVYLRFQSHIIVSYDRFDTIRNRLNSARIILDFNIVRNAYQQALRFKTDEYYKKVIKYLVSMINATYLNIICVKINNLEYSLGNDYYFYCVSNNRYYLIEMLTDNPFNFYPK